MACDPVPIIPSLGCCGPTADREQCKSIGIIQGFEFYQDLLNRPNIAWAARTSKEIVTPPGIERNVSGDQSIPCSLSEENLTDDDSEAFRNAKFSGGPYYPDVLVANTGNYKEFYQTGINSPFTEYRTIINYSVQITPSYIKALGSVDLDAWDLESQAWDTAFRRYRYDRSKSYDCTWVQEGGSTGQLPLGGECGLRFNNPFVRGASTNFFQGYRVHIKVVVPWCVVTYSDETRSAIISATHVPAGGIVRLDHEFMERFKCSSPSKPVACIGPCTGNPFS